MHARRMTSRAKTSHAIAPRVQVMYRYLQNSVSWRIPRCCLPVLRQPASHLADAGEGCWSRASGPSSAACCLCPSGEARAHSKLESMFHMFGRSRFSIWGAGRDGKNFYNDLSDASRAKVNRVLTCAHENVLNRAGTSIHVDRWRPSQK